ncbi:MAG: HEPN domain-containing protein [Phycisphaerae bacterium]
MSKDPAEWLKQADYDFETAESLFQSGRYFYAVFMCHLAIEKALKAVYLNRLQKEPPKTHNLLYLMETNNIQAPENINTIIFFLNRVSIPTRYPDDLAKMLREYNKDEIRNLLDQAREVILWIKEKL